MTLSFYANEPNQADTGKYTQSTRQYLSYRAESSTPTGGVLVWYTGNIKDRTLPCLLCINCSQTDTASQQYHTQRLRFAGGCCRRLRLRKEKYNKIENIIKIKIHSSCEIEDFVETHLCKLCVILRSRALRVVWPRPRSGSESLSIAYNLLLLLLLLLLYFFALRQHSVDTFPM